MGETDQALLARLESVSLRYGDGPEVFRGVSLDLPEGSFHFLVGPSGAGKTSLLRLLYLALAPTSGRLRLFGVDMASASRDERARLRRRIGIVHQDFRLLSHLNLLDNVALPLRIAGSDDADVRRDVERMLDRMGLLPLAQMRPPCLSGGEQQLAAIARALIVRPRLLVADEPTASVDARAALRLVNLFRELNGLGTTVLIATHNEVLAQRFHHPRLRLQGGRLTQEEADPALAGAPTTAIRRDPAAEVS